MRAELQKVLRNIWDEWFINLLLVIFIVESLIVGLKIVSLAGEISINRLFLLGLPVVFVWGGLILLRRNLKNPNYLPVWILNIHSKESTSEWFRNGIWILVFFLWAVAYLPLTEVDRWGLIYLRIQPIINLALLGAVELLVAWFYCTKKNAFPTSEDLERNILPGLVFAVIIAILWVTISLTGLGVGEGTQFWGKSGTPILHWQIGLSAAITIGYFSFLCNSVWSKSKLRFFDLIVFILFWIAAAGLWQSVQVEPSRFTTREYPPNYVSYPFSDAADYVLSAESILRGNGYQYGYQDKSLHLTFLAFVRILAGANFERMLQIQVALLAIFPSLIFLIGKKLLNRPAGLMAGILILFMQINSLAAINRIQVSNVKMMMAEPLTALALIIACIAVINWWKEPRGSFALPAVAGALLGIAGMVRLNTVLIFPVISAAWLVIFGLKDKRVWLAVVTFWLFGFLVFVPWMTRNLLKVGDPFSFITSKTEGVLLRKRIIPLVESPVKVHPTIEFSENKEPVGEISPETIGIAGLWYPMIHTGFHNLVTSALVLPADTTHNGLDMTIRQPYWDSEWNGSFTPGGKNVLILSIVLVAAGFGFVWRRKGAIALIPVLFYSGYMISNAISMVSGGRYIVPVDWIVPLYFAFGLTAVIGWFLKDTNSIRGFKIGETTLNQETGMRFNPWWQIVPAILVASLPAFLSLTLPQEKAKTVEREDIGLLHESAVNSSGQFTVAELQNAYDYEAVHFYRGSAMFPRWMKTGEGDTAGKDLAFGSLPFDHLSFTLLNSSAEPIDVVLPFNKPVTYLPDSSEVIVVGCPKENYFDAAIVYILSPDQKVYFRSDLTTLSCPFPQP